MNIIIVKSHFYNLCDKVGKSILDILSLISNLLKLLYFSIKPNIIHRDLGGRDIFRDIIMQIYFTGVQAFSIIFLVGIIVGGVVITQSASQLSKVGGGQSLGNILVMVIIRELGPIITAILLIARSATAITSELGNMKVSKEVLAFEIIGVDTLQFIVFPRIAGGTIALFCLSIYFVVVAILGGFVFANFIISIPFKYYIENILNSILLSDIIFFVIKNLFLSLSIFLIACYFGLQVKKAVFEIPAMIIKTVVTSLFFCLTINAFMSVSYYLYFSHPI